jgi:inosine-uridine nucleoside N-ribohydrolase
LGEGVIDIAFDMETNDPDDAFTLAILATHPQVNLVSVTVTPGSYEQIGLVRKILKILDKDVPVGSRLLCTKPGAVSKFHYRWLGGVSDAEPDNIAHIILAHAAQEYPDAVLVTGAPLQNPGECIQEHPNAAFFKTWVCQGGFAGDSVVPKEHRLAKFDGRETCPTFNLNGHPKHALALIRTERIKRRFFVSKNVCHGVVWDQAMHERMDRRLNICGHTGLSLVFDGMAKYLERKPEGKKFHDPLAACVAINPTVCEFRPVDIYREKGEWGSRLNPESNNHISVSVDREAFEDTLTVG